MARTVVELTHPNVVIVGMAIGWDQAVATACRDLQVPFTAVIPFVGQETQWPGPVRRQYHQLLEQAATIKVVSPGNSNPVAKLQKRNRWIVDNCDRMAVLWDGSDSGTSNAVVYAEQKGVDWFNLWEAWLKIRTVA